jgi:hypothetical protein
MQPTPTRHLLLLGACTLAPIGLGIAMHAEHMEAIAAGELCVEQGLGLTAASPEPIMLAVSTPVIVTPASASIPEPAGPGAGAYEFAHVIDIDGPQLVLATAIEDSWATDAPHYRGKVHDVFEVGEVWRNVDPERLPALPRAAIGRTVDVYSAAGRVCTARIGTPVLVGEMWGSIEYVADDELEVSGEGDDKVIDPGSAWDDSRRMLIAPLLDGGACADALWARDAALTEPLVYVAQEPSDLPSPVARRLLQRDPATRALGKAFAEHVADIDDEAFTTRRLVDRFTGIRWIEPTRGGELDVFTTDGEEFGGCGGFDPAWGAVSIDAFGTPTHAWLHDDTDEVRAIVDLDGDGQPEVLADTWLAPTRLLALGDELAELSVLPEVPFYGCPC